MVSRSKRRRQAQSATPGSLSRVTRVGWFCVLGGMVGACWGGGQTAYLAVYEDKAQRGLEDGGNA
jgi:hypothetical protein